jgi:hypothetical protein
MSLTAMIKTLLITLLLAIPAFAQTKPDLDKFTIVGQATLSGTPKVVLIDFTSDIRLGDKVTFQAIIANFIRQDGDGVSLDPQNYIFTDFTGDCTQKTLGYTRNRGMSNGRPFDIKYEKVEQAKVIATSAGEMVLEKACSDKPTLSAQN